ncbi:MAG: rod shape-determining protein [Christensenellales bacterium]|jgi:rod shape-determining protein MreB
MAITNPLRRGAMGIDLGTSNVLIHLADQGIVLREPTVAAVQKIKGVRRVIATGEEARRMIGRATGDIQAIQPLLSGVIADYEVTEIMLRHFVKKVMKDHKLALRPDVVICAPSGITPVERRAVEDVILKAGARNAVLVEEPLAAAIGAGLPIDEPKGVMIVDIGGGTTEVAVISMGSMVVSRNVRIGGMQLDDHIVQYIRREKNVGISPATAEELKIGLGSVYPVQAQSSVTVRGIDADLNLPTTVAVSTQDIYLAIREPVRQIVEVIRSALESAPPELLSDIMNRGVTITGGSSLLLGLDVLIHEGTGLTVNVAEHPLDTVAAGAGKIAGDRKLYRTISAIG